MEQRHLLILNINLDKRPHYFNLNGGVMLKDLILYLYDKELSRAEIEVFLLMASGYTYQEVADLRCCALKTVKYILKKL